MQAFLAAAVQHKGIWNLKDTRKLWQDLEHEICFKRLVLILLCFTCQDEQHKCKKSDMGRIHLFVQNKFYFSRWLLRIFANVTKKNLVCLFVFFFILEINLSSWWAAYSGVHVIWLHTIVKYGVGEITFYKRGKKAVSIMQLSYFLEDN